MIQTVQLSENTGKCRTCRFSAPNGLAVVSSIRQVLRFQHQRETARAVTIGW